MTEQNPISQKEINERLNKNGWSWHLISSLRNGIRIQLGDDGEEETGWRKCVEAPTLKEAIDKAEELVNNINAYEYGKDKGFNSNERTKQIR